MTGSAIVIDDSNPFAASLREQLTQLGVSTLSGSDITLDYDTKWGVTALGVAEFDAALITSTDKAVLQIDDGGNPILVATDPSRRTDPRYKTYTDAQIVANAAARYALRTGQYYGPRTTSAGTVTITAGVVYAAPFTVRKTQSFDRMAFNLNTIASSSVVRLAIYADNNGPAGGALVLDATGASPLDTSATTGDRTVTINKSLTPGLYWLAVLAQGGNPVLARDTSANFEAGLATVTGTLGSGLSTAASATSGSPPSTFPAVSGAALNVPYLVLRAA